MAFLKDDTEDGGECPVCYESLSGTERTLSCGHVFCHDCLVKTLVGVNSHGNIRDTIVCPICRHLTFIRKQKDAVVSLTSNKDEDTGQTLEVPVPLAVGLPGAQHQSAGTAQETLPWGLNRISRVIRWMPERLQRQRLVCPTHNASQIFIISAEGRPMAEEDALSAVMTVVQPNRRRRRLCTTARCLVLLLSLFTAVALVAATLPWILLA